MHPDDKAATKKFQEVQRAFDVLNDPAKRELYDRHGESFEAMSGRGGPGGPDGAAGGFRGAYPGGGFGGGSAEGFDFSSIFGGGDPGASSGGFSDLFSQFRGPRSGRGGRASTGPRRGANVEAELEIPFTTAVTGGETQMMLRREDGRVETITVKIPAGIEDGKKIRLRNQGEQPDDAPPGDLLVTVHVRPHSHFQRRGDHLDVKAPVTLAEAALGAKIDLPTPKGVISLRVPPGTSSGTKLRVKGHGVAAKGRPAGDLYAEIQIMLPKPLDEETLNLIRQIDAHTDAGKPAAARADLHW